MPSSIAASRAATLIAAYPASAAATTLRGDVIAEAPDTIRYTPYDTSDPTTARLKQFAPSASTPPSPKKRACINNATEIASIAAHGPSAIAASPIPTACPVVPPGSGRLNIISTNENAATSDSSGINRVLSDFLTRCNETYQKGPAAAYSAAQVVGLR